MITHFPYLTLKIVPAAEPVTLTETKLFLRVDGTADDALITRLITTARQVAEHYTRRSFITQTWTLAYDDYAPAETPLPKGPVQSVASVKSFTRDGEETVISSAVYYLNAGKETLIFDTDILGHAVEIEYVTGYGGASAVPDALKQGMLAHIADLYEKRPNYAGLSAIARGLYGPYRKVKL